MSISTTVNSELLGKIETPGESILGPKDVSLTVSLRDKFALAAMRELIRANKHTSIEDLAEDAYIMADEMLNHRSK